MGCNFSKNIKTGYNGQSYAVVIDGEPKPRILGWTNHQDGGGILAMAKLHPTYKDLNPRVEAVIKLK